MGREPRASSRTLSLPSSDDVPRTSRTYRLRGTLMDDHFRIGISVQPDEEGSIDDLPQAVHETLTDMAENKIDMDHVKDDTTDETWPTIGMVTITPDSEDTMSLFVEWFPLFIPEEKEE